MNELPSEKYLIESVARACDVLSAFRYEGELLRLRDVISRTGLDNATVFRLLRTLEAKEFIERAGKHQYQSRVRLRRSKNVTLGYAAQSTEFAFSRTVTESVEKAAAEEQVNLIKMDNRYSSKIALHNADRFIKEGVDLVMEFQTDERIAPVIAAKYRQAGIPLIAIEIPHPGATYYGADNYRAGLIGGHYLGRWAKKHWGGEVDEVILLELSMAGPLPNSRVTGMLDGIKEILPSIEDRRLVRLNGNGQFGHSLSMVRVRLSGSRARHVLVAALNDPSALGALHAFEESGRLEDCAVMGQNASREARREMRRPGTRLVGSVAYFPERYGEGLIPLALEIINKGIAPPAVFVKHQLVTPGNVDKIYPNDALLSASNEDNFLPREG